MNRYIGVLLLPLVLFAELEVVPIEVDLSDWAKKYIWPNVSNGGMYIDQNHLYIPDRNIIHIQSRSNPDIQEYVELSIPGFEYLTILKLTVTPREYLVYTLADDGRLYLFIKSKVNNVNIGPVMRHGVPGPILTLPGDGYVVGGAYRSQYAQYLDLYDDESGGGPTKFSTDKFDELYRNTKPYTLSYYSQELVLIDSANRVDRTGTDGKSYEGLFLSHPMDMDENGMIYYVDHDMGYILEGYNRQTGESKRVRINNPAFKELASPLTEEIITLYEGKDREYSIVNEVFVSEEYIVTTFYSSVEHEITGKSDYHFDILTLSGEPINSGVLSYPLVCSDGRGKVFLLVKREGGFFGKDRLFLVGFRTEDLLGTGISKRDIEAAIDQSINNAK